MRDDRRFPLSRNRILFFILLVVVLVLMAVFNPWRPKTLNQGAQGGMGRKAVSVATAEASFQSVPLELTAIGNVEAYSTVQIKPQVTGQLLQVLFAEGDYVQQGQLLFRIDPSLLQESVSQAQARVAQSSALIRQAQATVNRDRAQIQAAQANLQRSKSQLAYAAAQERRYANLLAQKFVTREQYEQLASTSQAAQATVNADQAAVRNASAQVQTDQAAVQSARAAQQESLAALGSTQTQLVFTQIRAPFAGKTGRLLLNAGNIVTANTSELVSISRTQPVYVTFTVSETDLSVIGRYTAGNRKFPVTATPNTTDALPQQGTLSFLDNTVDPQTGTIRLKAVFPNSAKTLLPGQFAQVRMLLDPGSQKLTIPAKAIQKGQQGDFVYVVQAKKVMNRPVKVERFAKGLAVISEGLQPGDVVVTEGQLQLAPKMQVTVRNVQLDSSRPSRHPR